MRIVFRQPIVAVAIVNAAVALIAFLKDIWLAAYAGTSLYADALTLAFFLPDSIGNNMLAAGISVACVPVFSRLMATEQIGRLSDAVRTVLLWFLAFSLVLMVLGFLLSARLVGYLDGSQSSELAQVTLPLLRLLLPTIVLFIIVAIGSAFLQTQQRFMIPAIAPLLFNFVFLAGVLYCIVQDLAISEGIMIVGISILFGVLIMALAIGWTSLKSSLMLFSAKKSHSFVSTSAFIDLKNMLSLFAPYVTILFCMQAVYLAERFLLTRMDTGAVAALNYAFRLTQLPIWVFVTAVSVVILPSLSRHLALEQNREVSAVMTSAFRSVMLIVLPAMLFLFVLREPVTIALFQRGAFDQQSVMMTSGILEGYSLSILSQAFSLICLRYFLAIRQLTGVLTIFIVCSVVTIGLDIGLIQIAGTKGIGYGAAIGALLNALLLINMYRRRVHPSMSAFMLETRRHATVLFIPLLLLPLLMGVWSWLPIYSSFYTLLFVLCSGCLFVLLYLFSLYRYWPALLTATVSLIRKERIDGL